MTRYLGAAGNAVWTILEEMAASEGVNLGKFLTKLSDEVPELHGSVHNFASLLRCSCLIYLQSVPRSVMPREGGTGRTSAKSDDPVNRERGRLLDAPRSRGMTRRQLTPLVCRNAQGIASPVPRTSRAEKRGTDPGSQLRASADALAWPGNKCPNSFGFRVY